MIMLVVTMMIMISNTNFCNLILLEFLLFLMRILYFRIQLDVDDLYKINEVLSV